MEESVRSDPGNRYSKRTYWDLLQADSRRTGKVLPGKPDNRYLTKATLKELKLVPDAIEDSVRGGDIIKRLLPTLGTMGNSLAELEINETATRGTSDPRPPPGSSSQGGPPPTA